MPNPQFERGQARSAQPVPAHLRLTGITGDFLEVVQARITAQGIAELASFPR